MYHSLFVLLWFYGGLHMHLCLACSSWIRQSTADALLHVHADYGNSQLLMHFRVCMQCMAAVNC